MPVETPSYPRVVLEECDPAVSAAARFMLARIIDPNVPAVIVKSVTRSHMVFPIVFTDLDGTLLDHTDYSFKAARQAIDALQARNIPVIFNTSKTQVESLALAGEIGLTHPVIVENGGAIVVPKNYDFEDPSNPSNSWEDGASIISLGANLEEIKQTLACANTKFKLAQNYRPFSTMPVSEVQSITGLDAEAAKNAKQRQFSEPIAWHGSDGQLLQLREFLREHRLRLVEGGRFHHVIGQSDKRSAMVHLARMYENSAGDRAKALIIALGDSKNDQEMLAGADIAVVVRNSAGTGLSIDHADVIYTNKEGPQGWQEAIEQILPRL